MTGTIGGGGIEREEELCFLLTGLAKSGKTTIDKIVFNESPGVGTESTAFMTKRRSIKMKVVDLPETSVILAPHSPAPFDESLFLGCYAVIFVVDITDDYLNALTKLCALVMRTSMAPRKINVEVLLHKADSIDEDERQDILKDITQKVKEEIFEICPDPPMITFHLTSIFDHTLYVCLSRIVQKHLPESTALETLLDMLCNNSKIEKAFLFDTTRKLFIATDSSPFGLGSFDLASETLDMICDLESIYSHPHRRKVNNPLVGEENDKESQLLSRGELRLTNGVIVGFHRVNPYLSMLYLLNGDSYPSKPEQLAHNVKVAQTAIRQVLEASIGQLSPVNNLPY